MDTASYVSYVDSLNGVVSGDYTGGVLRINQCVVGSFIGGSDVSIPADETGYRIEGFDEGASLQVGEAGEYSIYYHPNCRAWRPHHEQQQQYQYWREYFSYGN